MEGHPWHTGSEHTASEVYETAREPMAASGVQRRIRLSLSKAPRGVLPLSRCPLQHAHCLIRKTPALHTWGTNPLNFACSAVWRSSVWIAFPLCHRLHTWTSWRLKKNTTGCCRVNRRTGRSGAATSLDADNTRSTSATPTRPQARLRPTKHRSEGGGAIRSLSRLLDVWSSLQAQGGCLR